MTLAADLLRALMALGITFTVDGESFRASAPSGVLSAGLRARISEHRDALCALLALPDWRTSCTPCDEVLLEEDARRFPAESLPAVIGEWLKQYVANGYEPFLETAAWFAAVREAQDEKEVPHAA